MNSRSPQHYPLHHIKQCRDDPDDQSEAQHATNIAEVFAVAGEQPCQPERHHRDEQGDEQQANDYHPGNRS